MQHSNRMNFASSESWTILSPIEQSIKRKIETVGVPLKDWDISIYRGILTGFNEAFIISGEKKEKLIASDPKSAEIIRPILRGRDIKRYTYEFADLWLIATFPSKQYDIDAYPAVRDYLLSFGKERLDQTGEIHNINGESIKSRKKTNNKWFETQDSISYWDDFSRPKICWIELTDESKFSFSDDGKYLLNTVFFMVGKNVKYILPIINSQLIHWYFTSCMGTTSGVGTNRWLKYTVERIPIPVAPNVIEQKLINLVEQRLQNDNREIEYEIDTQVFSLFGLNENEIEFIQSLEKPDAVNHE